MNISTITAAPAGVTTCGRSLRPHRRAARLAAAAGGAALGLTALTAAPAWAHDELLSSTPEAGEVLTESPEEITLQFTGEGLTEGTNITNEIRVTDEDGESWETDTVVDGAAMSTPLDGELPDGEYEVVYRVVYSDGHDEEDSYSFEVELPEGAAEQADEDATQDVDEEEADAGGDAEEAPVGEDTAGGDTEAQNTEVDPAADADADPATAEGQFPAWAAVLTGLGGVLVVILAVVLMRRKMTQVEEWKQAPRQPRETPGGTGTGPHETGDSVDGTDGADDRPRDEK
ncbi:copper resistance protein CopC [Nesterenkonia sp. HG001]|uniref:copper resistance CopC family protein n=1 Tax=Nesterenkonia sp. HG001 TaxID=2983207 RepID=UPI002AC74F02|nr:copper resistance protein CopC [Nesterenkonia sp. HG001]MDZ5077663.1 copper resistance protein CopC [Nesterenkonia sp. HG001]